MEAVPANRVREMIHSEMVFVVYDGATGDIRHVHRSMALGRAAKLSAKEEEERALALARRFGHTTGELRVLQTDPKDRDPGAAWRVDVETRTVVFEDPGAKRDSV
jgi:hypothetical protein